jgi:hypothetical protein
MPTEALGLGLLSDLSTGRIRSFPQLEVGLTPTCGLNGEFISQPARLRWPQLGSRGLLRESGSGTFCPERPPGQSTAALPL